MPRFVRLALVLALALVLVLVPVLELVQEKELEVPQGVTSSTVRGQGLVTALAAHETPSCVRANAVARGPS